jgi:hypothetical protein
MKPFTMIAFSVTSLIATYARGHGMPLDVNVDGGRLIVSHPSDTPYAPPVFGQPDESDDFTDADSFPTIGNVILWDIPGVDIHGMDDGASLSMEVVARPVIGSSPAEQRLVWYWDPASETVGQSPAELHLLGTGARSLTLEPTVQESADPFVLADPVAGEAGFHNHSLLIYALDDDLGAPAGVYGFFARLTSNQYEASDPFLIVLNYVTENQLLPVASLAIHQAATLAGDFDLDNDVDGRDFLEWQRLAGSTTRTVADASLNGIVDAADLAIWQQHYGTVFGAGSPLAAVRVVPEPGSTALLAALLIVAGVRRGWSG